MMSDSSARILLVDNSDFYATFIKRSLANEVFSRQFTLARADRLATALELARDEQFTAIVLELQLPDSVGLPTFHCVHAAVPDVPILILTSLSDEALALAAVKAGAEDYLLKEKVRSSSVSRALRYAIERQRLRAEVDRTRKHALTAKTQFLSHICHQVRSPLAATQQFVRLVADGLAGSLRSEQQQYLDIALNSLDRLGGMIDELVDVSRVNGGKLAIEARCSHLGGIIDGVLKEFAVAARWRRIALSSCCPSTLPPVKADPKRISQILTNMIENALKFTPEGGHVSIMAEACVEDPEFIQISVRDTGCGIEPVLQESVFSRLFQAEPSDVDGAGLGLGLYICKELVASHGGSIWVESNPGAGSSFCFTLPVFSFCSVLGSALTERDLETAAVTVTTVEIRSTDDGKLGPQDEHALRMVYKTLRTLVQGNDFVFPRLQPSSTAELFFVIGKGSSPGNDAIAEEIRAELARLTELESRRLAANVFVTHLEDLKPQEGQAPGQVPGGDLFGAVRRIEGFMRSQVYGKTVASEW